MELRGKTLQLPFTKGPSNSKMQCAPVKLQGRRRTVKAPR